MAEHWIYVLPRRIMGVFHRGLRCWFAIISPACMSLFLQMHHESSCPNHVRCICYPQDLRSSSCLRQSAIAIVCYHNRPGKEVEPPPIPMTTRPNLKVVS